MRLDWFQVSAKTKTLLPCVMAVTLTLSNAPAQDSSASWTANDDFLAYFEAVNQVAEHSLVPLDRRAVIERSLDTLMKSLDPYSEYLSPEVYASYRDALRPDYVGVGMEILRNEQGAVLCFPYPGGPADRAGVQNGDRLIAVEGHRLNGLSLREFGSKIRGPEGSEVNLSIQRKGSDELSIPIQRTGLQARTVVMARRHGLDVLKIHAFTTRTAADIEAALAVLQEDSPLVLDVRSNPGGDLFGAIDAARLFLDKGSLVTTLRTRHQSTAYHAKREPSFGAHTVYLLQDGRTASAAEMFVAALTENDRAKSIGERSFGKGTTQRIIELMDGSGLVLTDAEILTPEGRSFHGSGLAPDVFIEVSGVEDDVLFSRIKGVFPRPPE